MHTLNSSRFHESATTPPRPHALTLQIFDSGPISISVLKPVLVLSYARYWGYNTFKENRPVLDIRMIQHNARRGQQKSSTGMHVTVNACKSRSRILNNATIYKGLEVGRAPSAFVQNLSTSPVNLNGVSSDKNCRDVSGSTTSWRMTTPNTTGGRRNTTIG